MLCRVAKPAFFLEKGTAPVGGQVVATTPPTRKKTRYTTGLLHGTRKKKPGKRGRASERML